MAKDNSFVIRWLFLMLGLLVGGLLRAFVLMKLWNWFATTAFHVSDISFLNVFGISLVIGMFTNDSQKRLLEERQWGKLMATVNYCVPEDLKPQMTEVLTQEFGKSEIPTLAYSLIGNVFGYAFALGIGFVIHVLAA